MVRIRLRGINRVRKRLANGDVVEYHMLRGVKGSTFWKSNGDVRIGSPEYLDAYRNAARPKADGKTFGSILDAYLASGAFRDLAPRTQADYRRWSDEIRKKWAKAPVAAFEDPRIRQQALKWRDQWSGRNADYAWTVLARIVRWAVDDARLLINHHLQRGSRRYKNNRAEIIWTESEIRAVEKVAPEWVGRALRAAVETGLRPGDLIRMSKAWVQKTAFGRRIQTTTNKRKRLATVPITQEMAAILDSTPDDRLLVLTNEAGSALTEEWLSKAVKKWARKAKVREELRLYDARGACVTRLVMAGATLSEIAAHMGWGLATAAKMIEVYAAMDPDFSDSVLVKLDQIRNKTANQTANQGDTDDGGVS